MKIEITTTDGGNICIAIPDEKIKKVSYEPITGDVNGDGEVSVQDAETVMDYLAGNTELNDSAKKAADADGDGKITYLDAMTIAERAKK